MSLTQSHTILCNATQETVYAVICDSSKWPERFEPCLAVEKIEHGKEFEHIRITAHIGGVLMTWESRRHFRREIFGIDSEVLRPMQLVKNMSAMWRVIGLNSSQCLLVLEHYYDIVDDVFGQVENVTTHEEAETFIGNAINHNSNTELKNIRDVAVACSNTKFLSSNCFTSHAIICKAPLSKAYSVIADVSNWPNIFDGCISATVVKKFGNTELVRIEAMQGDKLVSWETSRTYYNNIFRVDFLLTTPMPFMQSMSGQWRVVPIDEKRCLINVTRNFVMLERNDGTQEEVKAQSTAKVLAASFVEENAQAEMQSLRSFLENNDTAFCTFKLKYSLPYKPEDVYALLADVASWPKVLPHCESVSVSYDDSKNQDFTMQINTERGSEHFRSIRNCCSDDLTISYFQPKPPATLKTHSGNWVLRAIPSGTEILSEHSIRIDAIRCQELFGEDNSKRNKERIKELISRNSRATVDAIDTWLYNQRKAL